MTSNLERIIFEMLRRTLIAQLAEQRRGTVH